MIEKLTNFGPIVVINLESRPDRKDYIAKLFAEAAISDYKFFKAIRGEDVTSGVHEMSPGEIGCSMSHLTVLKNWLESESTGELLVVVEDDISFDAVKHWRWTWQEVLDTISFKFEILHLSAPTLHIERPSEFKIKRIEPEDNAHITTCYAITKEGAQKVVDKYMLNGELRFDVDNADNIADHDLLYKSVDFAYMLPIFTPSGKFGTDINPEPWKVEYLEQIKYHTEWLLENCNLTLSNILDLP